MKTMKMNEDQEDQGIRAMMIFKVSGVLQAEYTMWNETNLAGFVQDIFLIHTQWR